MEGDKFYENFGQGYPRAPKQFLPTVAKMGVAGIGGLIAGRLDSFLMSFDVLKPYYYVPTIGVFAAATAIDYFASDGSAFSGIAQQMAAGMAGWVGDDLWYALKELLGFGTQEWKAQPYKMGAEVKFKGVVYVASKDIPYPPLAQPGLDSRWVKRAQGFRNAQDFREAAQALLAEGRVWDVIGSDHSAIFGPEVEALISQQIGSPFVFSPEQRVAFRDRARQSLTEVVNAFANA